MIQIQIMSFDKLTLVSSINILANSDTRYNRCHKNPTGLFLFSHSSFTKAVKGLTRVKSPAPRKHI